ncbi:hypothetical protein HYH02_007752 [Chlamydomonas schloesseri]|uniref:Uncharacterized protein n=1 Tax=Chlamydomonas schloesseri TaxID=2026947 RepID=A0A836B4G4_9CHLO|nr:hypothetical protein HYH02_007752 [Chlamydomonas schloesseri]|eukprot:KAG2447426.1 hypothetical protein HYH02_007752 [Chlamydomonas schloesseri]
MSAANGSAAEDLAPAEEAEQQQPIASIAAYGASLLAGVIKRKPEQPQPEPALAPAAKAPRLAAAAAIGEVAAAAPAAAAAGAPVQLSQEDIARVAMTNLLSAMSAAAVAAAAGPAGAAGAQQQPGGASPPPPVAVPRSGPQYNPPDVVRLSSNLGAAHGAQALRKCFPDEIAQLYDTGESVLVQLWAPVQAHKQQQGDGAGDGAGEYQCFTSRMFLQKRTPLLFLRTDMLQALGLGSHAELQLRREGDRVLCAVLSRGTGGRQRKRQRGAPQAGARGRGADTDTDSGTGSEEEEERPTPTPTPKPDPAVLEVFQSVLAQLTQQPQLAAQLGTAAGLVKKEPQDELQMAPSLPPHRPPPRATSPALQEPVALAPRLPCAAAPAGALAAPATATTPAASTTTRRRPVTVADLGPVRGPQVLVFNRSQGACTGAAAIHRHFGAEVAAVKATGSSQRGRLWARPCAAEGGGPGAEELQEYELRVTCSKNGTVGLGMRIDLVRALGIPQPPLSELPHVVLRLCFEGEEGGEGLPDPSPPAGGAGGRRVICEVMWHPEEEAPAGGGDAGGVGRAVAAGSAAPVELRKSGSSRAPRSVAAQRQATATATAAAAAAEQLQLPDEQQQQQQQLLLLQQLADQQPHPAHLASRLVPIGGATGYLEELHDLLHDDPCDPTAPGMEGHDATAAWRLGGPGGGDSWRPPWFWLDEATVDAIFRERLRTVSAVMMQQGMRRMGRAQRGATQAQGEGRPAGVAAQAGPG